MTKGWVEVAQRCGRNAYRKVRVRVTNPDHLEAAAAPTSTATLKLDKRYQSGKVNATTDSYTEEG